MVMIFAHTEKGKQGMSKYIINEHLPTPCYFADFLREITQKKIREECKGYKEEHDMGKTIPYCSINGMNFNCAECGHFELSERAKRLMGVVK